MKIDFKKDSKLAPWHVIVRQIILFYWLKLRGIRYDFRPYVAVETEMHPVLTKYTTKDQPDYLKGFGSKSGLNKDTNYEEIAAFRILNYPETCRYIRKPKKKTCKTLFFTEKKRGLKTTQYIELAYWLPAWSHAGGTYPPHNDFSVWIRIKYIGGHRKIPSV